MVSLVVSEARRALAWTQADLAAQVTAASQGAISSLESGLAERTCDALRRALRARITEALRAGEVDVAATVALDRLLQLRADEAKTHG